ncbi:MAG TPA: hypothetical protein DD670_18910 [Planctomycetaceae bacterium]|nr:hypothetical protein [Planctomycetaceae bacterium]
MPAVSRSRENAKYISWLEHKRLRSMPGDVQPAMITVQRKAAVKAMLQVPVAVLNWPARRPAKSDHPPRSTLSLKCKKKDETASTSVTGI